MHCQECKHQLLELIYEEGIRPRRRLEMLNHVDSCPMCHEEYTTLLESRALLQEWPDEDAAWSLRVDPNYQASPVRRWLSAAPWPRIPRPAFQGALMGLLLLAVVFAAAQSQVTWNERGMTIHARLWKGAGTPVAAGMSQQEFLAAVDQLIAESEQRQNKLFGTALIKMYEDLEIRHRYEHGEIQTAFQSLQQQNEARWERTRQTSQ